MTHQQSMMQLNEVQVQPQPMAIVTMQYEAGLGMIEKTINDNQMLIVQRST